MNIIKKITVKCIKQDDLTGSDDLHFFINDNFIGRASISSGETKEFDGASLIVGGGPIFIDPEDEFRIDEFDIADPNDLLFKHKITKSDIQSRIYSETLDGNAKYEFTLAFE
ncbi:MAG: hypothetical protein ABIN94_22800 [Ferruginibacter sp.]